ncbi:MAG: hypothetical protein PHF35_00980 [Candidatus Moranbacteria bacterium]|nr:hypothetical protein [Candidatus Moranbacteria bacterium]
MKTAIKIIILAVVSAAIAVFLEQIIAVAADVFWQREIVSNFYQNLTCFLAVSVIIEELSKFWAIFFVIRKKIELSGVKLAIASFFLGAFWGLSEIGLIFYANPEVFQAFRIHEPQILFSLGSILALHTLTAFLMGVFISSNTFSTPLKPVKILFFPVLNHLLYNFLVIQKGNFTNYLVVISLSVFYFIGIAILAFNFRKLA